jgi:nucleoside-diphosphate-sugar epimerase
MKRILLTGATGFIGYEVARQLCEMGYHARFLIRRPLRGALLAPLGGELVQGDLERPESLGRAVDGVDTVLHLGARAVFEEYSVVRPTIVDGSVELMQAAISAGVQTFVYASSLLVYQSQAAAIDETTPAQPGTGYGRAKVEAEESLSILADKAGVAFAAIRLPHVYGARDLMFDQVRRGRVFSPGNGNNQFAHLHVLDAARLLISIAQKGWTGVSAVADHQAASWNDFFAEVRKYYPRFRAFGVPQWLAVFGTHLLTPLRRVRGLPSVYTPEAVRGWNLNLTVKPGLLWNDLDLQPEYPTIHEGIPAALDECIAFRWQHPLSDHKG